MEMVVIMILLVFLGFQRAQWNDEKCSNKDPTAQM
jgi:hypothetical protein